MSNESKGRTKVGAVGRRRSAPKSQLELRIWGRSEDASKAFLAEFGETMRETLAGAGIKGVRFRAEGHERLAYLPIHLVVIEVPDVAGVVEALNNDDDLEVEVIEEEGFRYATISLGAEFDGLPDEDGDDSPAPTAGGELAGSTVPGEEDEHFEPLPIEQEKKFTVVFVERPEAEGRDWDAADFLNDVSLCAADVFRFHTHAAKIQPLARTALLFLKLLDRVAPDLRRHPRAEELLVQMHDHAGELLLKHSEIEVEVDYFERRVTASRLLENLSEVNKSYVFELKLSLKDSEVRLKHVTEFTQRQIESRGLHADLGLNRAMLWLTLVTLAFGLLTLVDKYQSDRTFGLDAPTGLAQVGAVGLILVFFSGLSFRRQLGDHLRSSPIGIWLQVRTIDLSFVPPEKSQMAHSWWRWPLQKIKKIANDLQLEGAWWLSLESLQRIHTQIAPWGKQLDSTDSDHLESSAAIENRRESSRLDIAATETLELLEVTLNRLEWGFEEAEHRRAFGSQERLQQVEAMMRYLMRASSLVLEWELPLLPEHEVAYWLIAKPHIIKVGDNLTDEYDIEEALGDSMPPWRDSLGLSYLMATRMLMPVSEVDWLSERLDAAAKRLLDPHALELVEREGALQRLFHPKDVEERCEYWGRYDSDSWYAAAAEEGLTYDNLSRRWAEAQRREDAAEARG
jgi:hypothetical protein